MGYGYHSTLKVWEHALLGLEGVIVVVQKGMLRLNQGQGNPLEKSDQHSLPMLMPKDVDYLIPLLWQVGEELRSQISLPTQIASHQIFLVRFLIRTLALT